MLTLNEALNHNHCYVKLVILNGERLYGIFGHAGDALTVVTSREVAFKTAEQHDMIPMSVH